MKNHGIQTISQSPFPERLKKQLVFLAEIEEMKLILRRNLLADGSRRENDAEHSWHFALMAMVLEEYAQPGLDISRVVRMALVHDLVEVYAGDTFAYDVVGYEDKEEREQQAADRLFGLLPEEQGSMFRALWEEFEKMKTPEAQYAAAIDRLQPLLNNYYTGGHTWQFGAVTLSQVRARMEPIGRSMPLLGEFVEYLLQDCLRQGYLKE